MLIEKVKSEEDPDAIRQVKEQAMKKEQLESELSSLELLIVHKRSYMIADQSKVVSEDLLKEKKLDVMIKQLMVTNMNDVSDKTDSDDDTEYLDEKLETEIE